jgi:lipopolysaccharide transport system ATP-binding protein
MNTVAIRVQNVSKRYRLYDAHRPRRLKEHLGEQLRRDVRRRSEPREEEFWAVRQASFDVPRGVATAIIGRNGAGKSTLLRIMAGVTEPTSGRIELVGRVCAVLDFSAGFQPDLTGRENIYLSAAVLGMRRAETTRAFDAIVHFAGVERFLDVQVKRYSAGMQMRLGFAVVAHLDADILLLDEVLAVGDVAFKEKSLARIQEMVTEGRTVVFVTHEPSIVDALAQEAVLLDRGFVRAVGPYDHVLRSYEARLASSGAPAA